MAVSVRSSAAADGDKSKAQGMGTELLLPQWASGEDCQLQPRQLEPLAATPNLVPERSKGLAGKGASSVVAALGLHDAPHWLLSSAQALPLDPVKAFQRAQFLSALLRRLGLRDLRKKRNKAPQLVKESRDELSGPH